MTSSNLQVPWPFLDGLDEDSNIKKKDQNIKQGKTFAEALAPTMFKGDVVAVKIHEDAYQAGLKRCRSHLHGRLILAKGDQPMKFVDLKTKLMDLWSMVGKWSMISLGRGFYEFTFSSVEDMMSICATGSWNLKTGLLRLSVWTPDFNLVLQKVTHSQYWIKIYGLPQEYWCPSIIFTIAGGLGSPISLDGTTTNRYFGHFARVLVDINLKQPVPNKVQVERDGFEFLVDVDVENMPAFCTGCQSIGHSLSKCRRKVVEEVVKPMPRILTADAKESRQKEIKIVIDLDIERNFEVVDMESLRTNHEIPLCKAHEKDNKVDTVDNRSEIPGPVEVDNGSRSEIQGAHYATEFIVTNELPNPVAARDMAIVGRIWDEDEEELFTVVLSKSQKKRMQKKVQSEKVLYWNCRGFGNSKTRLVFKNYRLSNKPDLVFIAEPMIDFEEVANSFWSAIRLKSFGFNNRGCLKPNLWGLCNMWLNPTVLVNSNQHLACMIEVENKKVYLNAVYAHNSYLQRRQLWADMLSLMDEYQDFNVVLGAHECRGSNLPPRLHSDEFKLFTDAGSLVHLVTRGAHFTWTNRRVGVATIEKRLDRCISNEDWMNSWNQLSCSTLQRIASDHHPLLLCFDMGGIPRSSFKFQKMWLSHPDCQRLVSEVWKEELVGCPMFVLSQKLRTLKKEFKIWNVQVFGNIQERVKQAMSNVAAIQEVISSIGSDDDLLNQEHLAKGELLQALVVEEEFWKGKARINWQIDGDRNTGFFHKITKIRQASKALSSLRDGDTILVNQEQIAQHTLAYFTDLYASPNDARPNHLIQSVIPALSNLLALKRLIQDYATASGQHMNLAKCKFYTSCGNARRIQKLSEILGFSAGSLPFYYLGVPLFKGKPRRIHMQPIADRIIDKLATWKGLSLSIMGMVELGSIRNFIWSGNSRTRKLVTVAWKTVCTPTKTGGLGIRSLKHLNQAALLKLAWEMTSSEQDWAFFCRNRFGIDKNMSKRYFKSSIWHGIKPNWNNVMQNALWLVGDGKKVNFWKDNWTGHALVDMLRIPAAMHSSLVAKVSDFVLNTVWTIPTVFAKTFPNVMDNIVQFSISRNQDKLIWQGTNNGILSLKDAYACIKPDLEDMNWCKLIWTKFIPPSKSFSTWRLFHHKMPTDENLQKRGCHLASLCSNCYSQIETSNHVFLTCSFVVQLWDWLGGIFKIHFNINSIESLFLVCNRQWCPQVKGVLVAAIINTINTAWFCRNSSRFDGKKLSLVQAKSRIKLATSLAGNNSKLLTNNSVSNFKGWKNIWLECDSILVVDIFKGRGVVPWRLVNSWLRCMHGISSMRFIVTHIFREGNTCADRLAAFGVTSRVYTWWDVIPRFIFEEFNKNRLGIPNYRCNFL
ncbi:hypothetical protein Lal_00016748 [Lupinus albus]|nr:hypothetical protein Lal_00016748 [Lupinus albus]